jgi:hypothetical protein
VKSDDDKACAAKALQSIGQVVDERWCELTPEVQAVIKILLGIA